MLTWTTLTPHKFKIHVNVTRRMFFSAEHVNYFFNNKHYELKIHKNYEIVIVQNLAIRYVSMFLLHKSVPNFKSDQNVCFCILYNDPKYSLSCT